MESKELKKCPHCYSTNIAKILYGLPAFSEELDKELKTGKIALGGCMVSDDSPRYKCNDCQKKFGEKEDI